MASNSKIEWTDATWNPQHGCTAVSAGCANCYAIKEAYIHGHNHGAAGKRFQGLVVKQGNGVTGWTGTINFHEDRLLDPLSWRKPKRVFVNSMSDTFHADVPDEWLDRLFAVMALSPHITFQVLTKRPERAAAYLGHADCQKRVAHAAFHLLVDTPRFSKHPILTKYRAMSEVIGGGNALTKLMFGQLPSWPLPNVWCGTSVEDQKTADRRIPHLLQVPAAVRFLSCEPLLGEIDLFSWFSRECPACEGRGSWGRGDDVRDCSRCEGLARILDEDGVDTIHWVIVGGESGPKARPMHPEWARVLRDECFSARVAFFFKQFGEYGPLAATKANGAYDLSTAIIMANDGTVYRPEDIAYPDGKRYGDAVRAGHGKAHLTTLYRVGKKNAGRLLDDRTWDEFPCVESEPAA